jgi:hypothetical protein
MTRVIVTGTRDWEDTGMVKAWLTSELHGLKDLLIVHGGSGRVDLAAGEWAQSGRAREAVVPADWAHLGKSAGPRRNQHMVNYGAALCLAFWDGESRGTLDCIKRAVRAGILVRIVPPNPTPAAGEEKDG